MRVLGNHHSLPWSKILLASLAKFPFSKICSLRSQIFRFLHASSVSAFAHFVRDMFASLTFLCLCFRSLRSRYVRKICSLRSQIFRFLYASSVSAFARFARDMFAKSVRFAHRFSVFYMHFLMCFRSLRSRYVRKICSLRLQIFRFLHALSDVFSFTSFAICSLRSQNSGICTKLHVVISSVKKAGFSETSFYGWIIHRLFCPGKAGASGIFMFTAIDGFSKEKKETFASYVKGGRVRRRFICPECGEFVIFYGGSSQAPHFRHYPRTCASPECTKRFRAGGKDDVSGESAGSERSFYFRTLSDF